MNKSRKKYDFIGIIMAIFILAVAATGVFVCYNAIVVGQNPIAIEDIQESSNTVIYDRNGEVFEVIGNGNAKDTAEEFPELLENAVLAVEDKRFYEHGGVDIIRTGKVIIDTLINREFGAGGSTITQQLVKNISGDDEVSISRKVRELFYAMQLEQMCSKQQILIKYLNIIYLGKGNFGMIDACKAYFGKTPDKLSLAEAAFMAAVIKSPETYVNDMERANERKNLVLGYMLEQHMISEADYKTACSDFVKINARTSGGNIYSWFSESVLYEFATMYADTHKISYSEALDRVMAGGYKIYSTVDAKLQSEVYNQAKNMSIGAVQSATLVMNKQGEVVACSGATGKKTSNLGFNRAVQARRQPGSAIKPLAVYGPALEADVINPMTVYNDHEITYGSWTPQNYTRKFYGNITMRKAVAISNNGIPVQLLYQLGTNTGIEYLQKMGFETKPEDNALTLALGAVHEGYSLPEMASGYQTILNGGTWCEPVFFTKIEAKSGKTIYNERMQDTERVFSEDTAYILTDMLMSVVNTQDGTATTLAIDGMQIAAKTGTTTNNRDKWCCAFNPEYVVVTWCGYDEGPGEIDVSSSYIQKHMRRIFKVAPTSQWLFDIPSTVKHVEICSSTGMISNGRCESTYTEVLKASTNIDTCHCEGTIIDTVEDWWNDWNKTENIQVPEIDIPNNIEGFFNNLFGNNNQEPEETTVVAEEHVEEASNYEEVTSEDVMVPNEEYYE